MSRKDMEHLHAAARTAYLESRMITEGELIKAAEAATAADAYKMLSSKLVYGDRQPENYRAALEKNLTDTYMLVEDITDNSGLTHVFRYPIDGHNLKVMIKSRQADGDYSYLYKTGGTVSVSDMEEALRGKKPDTVCHILASAGREAVRRFAAEGDPQIVDLIIDRAVIAMMKRKAQETGDTFTGEYVTTEIDMINTGAALRLLRIDADVNMAEKAFAEGGSFSWEEFKNAFAGGYDGIIHLAEKSGYGPFADRQPENREAGEHIERMKSKAMKELFDSARRTAFGTGPVISFLYLKEREIKGCRFVLASKDFGIPANKIKEGLGEIYGN